MNLIASINYNEYKKLIDKIDEIHRMLELEITCKEKPDKWLNNSEVSELLNVSTRTLQNYRDNGKLPFSQVGSKIYYKYSDIEEYLNKHYVKSNYHIDMRRA